MKPRKKDAEHAYRNFFKKTLAASNNDDNDAESESSDDEDFVCEENLNSNSESSSSSDEEEEENDTSNDENTLNLNSSDRKIKEKKTEISSNQHQNNKNLINSLKQKYNSSTNKFKICCVCLVEKSDDLEELVECDSCGFYAHESCYGISEQESLMSTSSSSSTEPWFCDSCLLDDALHKRNQPISQLPLRECELCPNVNCGLLKETENGKFVHIVCALYTPGVAFQDTDRLWPVVLDEIPPSRWSEKTCSLCENPRYSRSGICIKCDAGLCKIYFHATCAQKNGFLVDPNQQNPNDPYLAYCKLHEDKTIINARKKNYLTMISDIRQKMHESSGKRLFLNNANKDRFTAKHGTAKELYLCMKQKANRPYSLTQKVPRKRKKISQYHKDLAGLKETQSDLVKQEETVRNNYENELNKLEKLKIEHRKNVSLIKNCVSLIELFVPRAKFLKSEQFLKILKSDDFNEKESANEKRHQISIASCNRKATFTNTNKSAFDLNKSKSSDESAILVCDQPTTSTNVSETTSSAIKKSRRSKINFEIEQSNITLDSSCSICNSKTNSHLLVECDTCKLFYHINCLDPPLSSVPKKTKLYGWECSKCVRKKDSDYESEEDDENGGVVKEKIDLNAPRTLRQIRKPKTAEFGDYQSSTKRMKPKSQKKLSPKKKVFKKFQSASNLLNCGPREENDRLNLTIETINPSKLNKKLPSPRSSILSQTSSNSRPSIIILDSNSDHSQPTNENKINKNKQIKTLNNSSSVNKKLKKRPHSANLDTIENTIDLVIASSGQAMPEKSLDLSQVSNKSVYDFESTTDESVPSKMPCLKRNNSKNKI